MQWDLFLHKERSFSLSQLSFYKIPTLKIFPDELVKVCMVFSKVFIIFHQVVIERTVCHDLAGRPEYLWDSLHTALRH